LALTSTQTKADRQAKANIIAERDKLYTASAAKKAESADIPDAKVDPGADSWQKGQALQLDLKTVSVATR